MKKVFFFLFIIMSSISANYSWSPNVQLSDPTAGADRPSIALDSNGNAVAIWRAIPELVIQAATKPFGQPWSAPQTISPINEFTNIPLVRVDGQGNAVAIWSTSFGGNTFRSATKLLGQPWSTPDLVPGSAGGIDFDFVVALNGNATLIWYNQVGMNFNMLASEKSLLGTWSAVPTTLSTGQAFFPKIGIDANGNVIGTWQDNQNIVFARKPFGSLAWGPVLTAFGGGGAFGPRISVNRAGNAMISWSSSAGVGISYIPFNQAAQPAQIIPGSSTDPNSQPNIGLDNNNNAIAIWFDSPSGNYLSSIKLFGQPLSFPTIFASHVDQNAPSINVNGCNSTLVAFSGSQVIEVSSGIIGSSFSAPFSIASGITPAIDQNPCGHAMVLWQGNQGNPSDIEASEGSLFSGVTSFSGVQRKNDFGTLSEYENHLNWTIAPTQNISGFHIYRNGSPYAIVKPNEDEFIDVRQKKNVRVQYGIAVINSQGAETSQTIITVP